MLPWLAGASEIDAQAPRESLVDTTFTCRTELNGAKSPVPCAYRLYVDSCQTSGTAQNLHRACHRRFLTEFKIGNGDSKSISGLPASYRYCMGVGEFPTADECARSSFPR